ncbi:MAG: replication initiation protein [Bacteroidales bacterium]
MEQNEDKEKDVIKITGGTEEKQFVRENKHLTLATTGFSGIQMNMFIRAVTKFDLNPENIENERRYLVEFQRSEVPLQGYQASKIEEELKALQDITITSNSESGWSRLKPFPKVGEYNKGDGTIQIWFDGEYLKPILELKKKEGWAVFLVAEMFSLQGRHSKKLFEIFSGYKNRNKTRLEYDVAILKKILGIPDKYKNNPGLFMKKVVHPAVDQINEKTSIQVNACHERKKGKRPTMVIFDVYRKEKLEEKTNNQTLKDQDQPNEESGKHQNKEEKRIRDYFNSLKDKRHLRCYTIMRDKYRFTQNQSYNCANNKTKMELFFAWQYETGMGEQINKKIIHPKEGKDSFFATLKAKKMKI